jgi:uncharacterized protein YbcC (UPF0753/DUF2309 family)
MAQTDYERYTSGQKKMQTGVAFVDELEGNEKHLRVGLNTLFSDFSALATLLVKKGVFTEDEYLHELANAMDKEVSRCQAMADAKFAPGKVTLGECGI